MKTTLCVAAVSVVLSAGGAFAQTSSDAAIRACEASIIGGLRSPASYQPFKIEVRNNVEVEVIYDAANGFGALLRGKSTCHFVLRDDGLHLTSEPDMALEAGIDECMAEIDGWVRAGNITERASKPFRDQCSMEARGRQSQFMQTMDDLNVEYPVPPEMTEIGPKP